jgi:SpoVK/Ycf46/Vps4 family AAA+-type ATPase
MDNLIATVPFVMGDGFEEGNVNMVQETGQISGTVFKASSASNNLDDLLFESLSELNALTGLENIKKEVNEMVQLVRYYQETGKDVMNKFSLHTVFTGNPGTGKTTVARIMSKIYKGLGILEKGHLVEIDREGLVAGYIGQTAIKTVEKVNEAMGGILFIDEAYALAQERGSQHDFGGEAIQAILKRMEDQRGKFGVIVAGYTGNMQEFINSNPGLRSRFDKYFEFEDYKADDMFVIAMNLFN